MNFLRAMLYTESFRSAQKSFSYVVFHDDETKFDKVLQASQSKITLKTNTNNLPFDNSATLLPIESADLPMRCG